MSGTPEFFVHCCGARLGPIHPMRYPELMSLKHLVIRARGVDLVSIEHEASYEHLAEVVRLVVESDRLYHAEALRWAIPIRKMPLAEVRRLAAE